MAQVTSLGIGSNFDAEALVSGLVSAERQAAEANLKAKESRTQSKVSAMGTLKSVLDNVKTSLEALKNSGSSAGRAANVPADAGFSVSANSTAPIGSFGITVEAVASAARLQSAAFAPGTTLDAGTLTFQVGGESFDIQVEADWSLDTLRNAINTASGGKLTAGVVSGDAGDHLVISGTKTGAANDIVISAPAGGNLAGLATSGGSMTTLSAAADAVVVIDGVRRSSASNVIEGAVTGVTITVAAADVGKTTQVGIEQDAQNLQKAVEGFVTAYNNAITTLAAASKSGQTGSAILSGDALVRGMAAELRTLVSTNYAQLDSLGLKGSVNGTLSLDASKFSAAISANPQAVKSLFGDDAPFGSTMRSSLDNFVGVDGLIQSRTKSLNSQLTEFTKQRERIEQRLASMEARLRKSYAAMDLTVSRLNGIAGSITSQMDQFLVNFGNKAQ